jgi:hypothetical protein
MLAVRFTILMSVEDIDKIDIISTEEVSDTVTLTVTDHLEWGNPEHLYTLQEKLNTYLRFIESGEIYQAYPNAQGSKLKIDLKFKYPPDKEGKEFLNKCTDIVLSAGYQFGYAVL